MLLFLGAECSWGFPRLSSRPYGELSWGNRNGAVKKVFPSLDRLLPDASPGSDASGHWPWFPHLCSKGGCVVSQLGASWEQNLIHNLWGPA